MKKKLKKWLRPVLFTLGGALMGLGTTPLWLLHWKLRHHRQPGQHHLYMGLMGWLLSGIFGSQSA